MSKDVTRFMAEFIFSSIHRVNCINKRQICLLANGASKRPYPGSMKMNHIRLPFGDYANCGVDGAIPGNLKEGNPAGMDNRLLRLSRDLMRGTGSSITAMSDVADYQKTADKQHPHLDAGTSRGNGQPT